MKNPYVSRLSFITSFLLLAFLLHSISEKISFSNACDSFYSGNIILDHKIIDVNPENNKILFISGNNNNIGTACLSINTITKYGTYRLIGNEEVVGMYSGRIDSSGQPMVIQIAGYTDAANADIKICISGHEFSLHLTDKPQLYTYLIEEGTSSGDFYLSANATQDSKIYIDQIMCAYYPKKYIKDLAIGTYYYSYR
ncbi:hypothetical protein [Butyrivibrio sp. XPD2006]|uniref:hypothetical protein n=1 Tax=Butyrivibrio sp. XPD2006 TaxID=1280668 RepID=UPI0003B39B07|nr:hypothetical protein [Butyrivibrio sp. XPD2006]